MSPNARGFTLIEIIFVITIMVVVYAVAIPQFNLITGTESAEKLGQVSQDIRAAFDMAVLKNKPHRLVFMLESGDYWLEEADRSEIFVGDDKRNRELSIEEEKEIEETFEETFKEYEDLAGQDFKDPDSDKVVKPFSPVLQAKERLSPVKWKKIETMEWRARSLGPSMIIKSFQSEHLAEKQTAEGMGEKARGILYFFPQGYVEQCSIIITMRKGSRDFDEAGGLYSVICNPYEGIAGVEAGEKDYEFKDRDQT